MKLTFLIVFTIVSMLCGLKWARPDQRDWVGVWNVSLIIWFMVANLAVWIIWAFWK